MKKILLLDDDKAHLADTITELKLAGCEIELLNNPKAANDYLEIHKDSLGIVAVALNNALRYPAVRKVKNSISVNTQLCIYSNSSSISLREWVYKQQLDLFFTAPFQKKDFIEHCKKAILNKNIHFSHSQLLNLTEVLTKYTDVADNLVQKHAASSNSIQELQHKLARSLVSFEHQKNFLSEVQ